MVSWASASFGLRESTLAIVASAAAKPRVPVVRQISPAHRIVDPSDAEQRVEVVGIERQGALKKAARLRHIFGR